LCVRIEDEELEANGRESGIARQERHDLGHWCDPDCPRLFEYVDAKGTAKVEIDEEGYFLPSELDLHEVVE
jgi:hypothetical protein